MKNILTFILALLSTPGCKLTDATNLKGKNNNYENCPFFSVEEGINKGLISAASGKFLDDWNFSSKYVELSCKGKEADFNRMLPALAALDLSFKTVAEQNAGKSTNAIADLWIESSGKASCNKLLFPLESLGRLYSRGHLGSKFAKAELGIKELEDAVGAWDAWNDFIKFATEKNADATAVENLKRRQAEDRTKLANIITTRWLAKGHKNLAVSNVLEFFSPQADDLVSNKRSDKELVKTVVEELRRSEEKIRRLVMSDLETGLHEFRRTVRSNIMYINALDGLIGVGTGPGNSKIPAYNKLLTDNSIPIEYTRPSFSGTRTAIANISQPYWLALSHYVQAAANVKDAGQNIKYLSEAYSGTTTSDVNKLTEGAGRSIVQKLAPEADGIARSFPQVGEQLRAEILANKLLSRLADEIEDK